MTHLELLLKPVLRDFACEVGPLQWRVAVLVKGLHCSQCQVPRQPVSSYHDAGIQDQDVQRLLTSIEVPAEPAYAVQ